MADVAAPAIESLDPLLIAEAVADVLKSVPGMPNGAVPADGAVPDSIDGEVGCFVLWLGYDDRDHPGQAASITHHLQIRTIVSVAKSQHNAYKLAWQLAMGIRMTLKKSKKLRELATLHSVTGATSVPPQMLAQGYVGFDTQLDIVDTHDIDYAT